jgi:delta 1-pyrroline-5-carboxylate dehydrogenase
VKTVKHTNLARDRVLHIEADGAIINVTVGLYNDAGQRVTMIEVIPDDPRRVGGPIWTMDRGDGVALTATEVLRLTSSDATAAPACPVIRGGTGCVYRLDHDLSVFPHRFA